jgi:ribose transport system substrate-binding protein
LRESVDYWFRASHRLAVAKNDRITGRQVAWNLPSDLIEQPRGAIARRPASAVALPDRRARVSGSMMLSLTRGRWCESRDCATLPSSAALTTTPSATKPTTREREMFGKDMSPTTRRNVLQAATAGALLGGLGVSPVLAAELGRSEKPLKAAFSNAGLQATWCAQGKQAAESWGKLFNVEVTWFDGQLDAVKQRAAIDNMASQKWDFVAIQAFGIGTLTQPVQKMIDAGIPVIDMDTLIAPLDQINVHSFLAPDNEFMGASVTQALVNALGGKGKVIMTQGALGHTGAQGRAKGFNSVVKQFPNIEVLETQPADWDVSKTARLWETYLTKYPQIDAAFFHNDDMALAAYNIMKAHNRTNILIGGVDAQPPAIQAVIEGRMFATVRNPSCRIHGGAIVAGVAAVTAGEKTGQGIPKSVVTDGPVVTKANAAGMLWMEDHFLI